jgi:dTDP-glucose 4,6-dehydratase
MTLNGFEVAELEHAVAHIGPSLGGLAQAHILLTGGTGFFGQWLLASLIHANRSRGLGIRISVVTRSGRRFVAKCPQLSADPAIEVIEGDVRVFSPPRQSISHVIHAATDTNLAADARPLELLDTIFAGTRHVLEFARLAGAKDVLYVSSGAVYGPQGDEERVGEDYRNACDPLDRRSAYAEGKRLGEQLCAIYAAEHGLAPRIARCFAFVGPGMLLDAHFAIGNFIRDAVAGSTIEIKGDGTPVRSYLSASDLIAWLIRTLALGRPMRAYNVGSDYGLSLKEIAQVVAHSIPSAKGVSVATPSFNGGYRSRYVPSIDRARAELGVDVWTPLDQAIASTARWAQLHGNMRPR